MYKIGWLQSMFRNHFSSTRNATPWRFETYTARCLLLNVCITDSHGSLPIHFQVRILRCRSITHCFNKVTDSNGGTSILRTNNSTNTKAFPSLMGISLTSLVWAMPPTPLALVGMDATLDEMITLLIQCLFSPRSRASK